MDLNKDVLRVFWQFFCMEPIYIKTTDWQELYIYDAPTQYFIELKNKWLIYWVFSDESKQIVNKIVKDNSFEYVNKDNVSAEDINSFRKIFRNHPEIESQVNKLIEAYEHPAVELFNSFLSEVAKYKIYKDEDLSYVREFRVYLSKKNIGFDDEDYSWDLKTDLYWFLEFDRFNTDEFVKQQADKTLNYICREIDNGSCPDIRKFKKLDDRDQLPDTILSRIEKLVLYNYCDKPNVNVVKEIRTAVEQMDLDLLKDYMDFRPKWRQRYALVYESRENLAVNSRRSWKSFLVVYIAIRQLMLPGQMILYILPVKEDYSEQPFFYIEQMLENVKKRGAELIGFQFNAKQFRVVNKPFKSKIIFLSGQWSSKWKSFSANLVIIDEAAMIDDEHLYDQAYNSTTDTKWRCRAISTINVETPVNRFFYKKITLEWTEDAKVHNVNLYDNPFIREAEKKKIEKDLKEKNPQVWSADWMAIFVGWEEWFDTSKFFQIDFFYDVVSFKGCKFNLARNLDKYERFMLFYDPAKNKDKAWIALIWKIWYHANVVMTGYIDIKNYYAQREVIMDILNYVGKIRKIELGIDLWKAWEAAFDWFENQRVAPYGILSTGWSQMTEKTFRRWNVPANIMEANLHSLMAAGVVTWFSWLDNIRTEFETYTLTKERRGWFEQHHDILSALMNACYIRYERWFIDIDKQQKEIEKPKQLTDAWWRPIKMYTNWQFNGNLLSRFLH